MSTTALSGDQVLQAAYDPPQQAIKVEVVASSVPGVNSINTLTGAIILAPGTNITITPAGNIITIASPNTITGLTGDVTATGPGNVPATLATVNANTGSFGTSSSVPTFTVNGKGLITAVANAPISIAQSQVTGNTNNALTSIPNLSTVDTITTGTWNGSATSGSLFITAGTTYTTPSNISIRTQFKFTLIGGGGGSGGMNTANGKAPGAGGGGGLIAYLTGLTPSTAYVIAIGAGGTAGTAAPTSGGNGGNTTLTVNATTYTAGGGTGGVDTVNSFGAFGGGAANGAINIGGGNGGSSGAAGTQGISGAGGSSPFGFGIGGAGIIGNFFGGAFGGSGFGAGAGGAATTACPGAAGTQGCILVEWQN